METSLNYEINIKLSDLVNKFKLSNIEDSIMKILNEVPKSATIYYIGEYNKTDPML